MKKRHTTTTVYNMYYMFCTWYCVYIWTVEGLFFVILFSLCVLVIVQNEWQKIHKMTVGLWWCIESCLVVYSVGFLPKDVSLTWGNDLLLIFYLYMPLSVVHVCCPWHGMAWHGIRFIIVVILGGRSKSNCFVVGPTTNTIVALSSSCGFVGCWSCRLVLT